LAFYKAVLADILHHFEKPGGSPPGFLMAAMFMPHSAANRPNRFQDISCRAGNDRQNCVFEQAD
jgi:hypothetical protein